ncbi:MAG: hypothetical protein A4E63_00969 [Syntrophorhabdus sp. PtaU1.Bin050]|nr:MAG: hypothetical protein A4E63_00969 [Syntrophorhabdus sp. PtaU1.Bin050]
MEPTCSPGDILRETRATILACLGNDLKSLTIERTVIGLFFTGVKLNSGHGGLCFTPIKSIPDAVCCPSSAMVMPASGKLNGRKATRFLDEMFSGNPLKKTMGIAVLNALSSAYWKTHPPESYRIRTGIDALDEVTFPDNAFVVVVGALVPTIRSLKQRAKPFAILELDSSTLKTDELEFFVPFEKAHDVVPQADLLVITGTTLINDTLEGLLEMRKTEAEIIVVGPTASMLPDAFLERGVTRIGGVIVTDADGVLDVIAEAGSGYHFFGKGAERVVIQATHTRLHRAPRMSQSVRKQVP